jgi:hypothetical protein
MNIPAVVSTTVGHVASRLRWGVTSAADDATGFADHVRGASDLNAGAVIAGKQL